MKKEEVKKAIKNGKTLFNQNLCEINLDDRCYIEDNLLVIPRLNCVDYENLDNLFETKAQAEHYKTHSNITRTEKLPFITWEEFENGEALQFYNKNRIYQRLAIVDDRIFLYKDSFGGFYPVKSWELTEENFYKAYDECVKLFKG